MALRKIFSRINYDTPEEEYILGPIVNKHITKDDVQRMSERDKITKAFISHACLGDVVHTTS